VTAVASAGAGCRTPPAAAATADAVVWREVGNWAGRGNTQTGSFTGETGSLRIRWKTGHGVRPGDGTFRLTLHSAISGRPLLEAVEHRGAGADTSYVSEDPRVFFFVVDSSGLDWSFAVDEGFAAKTVSAAHR